MNSCDVAVVGAGLAGASAAAKLSKSGLDVLIIEARDRVGGRAFCRPFMPASAFGDSGPLEFGGAWITPWHHRIRELVAEHSLALRPRPPVTRRLWLRDGEVHDHGPTADEDRARHERAVARVAMDAALYKKGFERDEYGRAIRGIGFAEYLDRLSAPRSTRDLFSAWWTVSGNGDPLTTLATEFLSSCEYGGGLAEGMIEQWVDTVSSGMSVLAERLIAGSHARLSLSTPVSAVTQSPNSVTVETGDGRRIDCRAAVVALGINQMKGLRFEPGLSFAKTAAIQVGHGGCAFKAWIKAHNVAVGTLATGGASGIEWAFAEHATRDGSTMIVAFGIMDQSTRLDDPQWVGSEIAKLIPHAKVLSSDWHDWVNDPFACGTWLAAKVGGELGLHADNWHEEGRIFFASSDIAQKQAGWFEGAVISGEHAAGKILERVSAHR